MHLLQKDMGGLVTAKYGTDLDRVHMPLPVLLNGWHVNDKKDGIACVQESKGTVEAGVDTADNL